MKSLVAFFALPALSSAAAEFPRALSSYAAEDGAGLGEVLRARAAAEPFNTAALVIFVAAIVHTFLTAKFRHWAHVVDERHAQKRPRAVGSVLDQDEDGVPDEVCFGAQILHFLGEVEAVFGIWALALMGAIAWFFDWHVAVDYVGHHVNFTEAMFVVVIMAIAGTRPVLWIAEKALRALAGLGRGTVGAWWITILIVGPVLGSFITEPAAMTIAALLLARQFYAYRPSARFGYATLGLLFVNVSVGGTLTHFAAPPVLMVAAPWSWNTPFMFLHFGWKAIVGIIVATLAYYFFFRTELRTMNERRTAPDEKKAGSDAPIPAWVVVVQLLFMAFVVMMAHYPPLFIGAFLFFLAFSQATAHHQGRLELKAPLLVGFFLAGLVVHGGVQGWWIDPVLRSLGETQLFLGATLLTAVNDNAAITYLATLVPEFTPALKYAVVAGAVTGGGLTVIANAPNPAGQNILQRFFPQGVSPLKLFLAAVLPTVVMAAAFLLL